MNKYNFMYWTAIILISSQKLFYNLIRIDRMDGFAHCLIEVEKICSEIKN